MKNRSPLMLACVALSAAQAIGAGAPAAALQIIAAPADYAFAHAVNPSRGYVDVMVQTVLIHNDGDAPVAVASIQLDLLGENGAAASKSVPVERAITATANYAGMLAGGFGVFLSAQLLDEAGLAGATGDPDASLSDDAALAPGEAVLLTGQYLAADFAPQRLAVTVSYTGASGAGAKTMSLEIRQREQKIRYIAPLKGTWMVSGFPNLISHHRFIPSNEFALDFFRRGPDGALDKGVRLDATDDYGYDAPVRAVADGEVVFVINDEVQDAAALSRADGESIKDAQNRITAYQMKRFAEDFRAAATGNIVIIRHEADGAVEYSSYGHLREGSITVKPGDRVRQGDIIAAVGNTGDSTLTHLHFQLNAGPDPFFSRSLPVVFDGEEPVYVGQEPGDFRRFE